MTSDAHSGRRAVVLAAGQGKRMKSSYPKVLHPVLGKSILARVLDALDGLALDHIHVVVGHAADQVREFLDSHPPSTPFSLHLQEPQLGTGHALMQVTPSLGNFSGTLLTTVSDTPLITSETLLSLLESHARKKAAVSLLTTVVDDAKNYGRIVRDQAGNVVSIVEDKDATESERAIKEVNPAIYCLEWPACDEGLKGLKNDNRQKEYYLTDLIGWAAKRKLPIADSLAPDWREVAGINSRLELTEAVRLMRDKVAHRLAIESGVTIVDPQSTWIAPEARIGEDTVIMPGSLITGQVVIGRDCQIGPSTVIEGPVKIGDRTQVIMSLIRKSEIGSDCGVGPFAHMREGAVVSDCVRVGNFVEIKKSSVAGHTNVSHLSYIGDATIGAGTNIGAGTITANYNHVTKTKSRTVIGDNVSTGSNSVLVAPVEVGDAAMVAAGTVVTRDVPAGALAVGRARQENKSGWAAGKRKPAESDKTPG